jgi:hypothetical protein
MEGSEMTDDTQRQLRISFDLVGQPGDDQWIDLSQEAIERASLEMQDEGAEVSIAREYVAGRAGDRAVGWDDLLVGMAANMVTSLLGRAISELLARFRGKRSDQPISIELQAGDETLEIRRDMVSSTVYTQLTNWVPKALELGSITIRIVK